MIIFALLGSVPLFFGASLAIGDAIGTGWQIAAIPFFVCLGIWIGAITAGNRHG